MRVLQVARKPRQTTLLLHFQGCKCAGFRYQRGADIEAQRGLSIGVQFHDSAKVGSETGKARGMVHASSRHCLLIVDESWTDLAKESPVLPALPYLDAEQSFGHRFRPFLLRQKVHRAVEPEPACQVVIKICPQS